MAKKKKRSRLYLQTPANWYRAHRREEREGELLGHVATETARLKYTDLLKDDIKLLRKFSRNFEPSKGYSLNKLIFIPDHKIDKVREYAKELRRELSRRAEGTKIFRPRSPRSKRTTETYTRATPLPGRKAYAIPLSKPDTSQISVVTREHVVRDKKGRRQRVKKSSLRITRTVRGGRVETDSFLFMDYTDDPPYTFDEIEAIVEKMLPHLPQGHYTFISTQFGSILAPMRKNQILNEIRNYWTKYDLSPEKSEGHEDNRGLAETLIGLRLTATTEEGAHREYNARQSFMEKLEGYRQAEKLGRLKEFRKKHGMDLIKHRFERGRNGRCTRCGKSQAKHLR